MNEKAFAKTPPVADEYQATSLHRSHRFNLLFREWETVTQGSVGGSVEKHSPADTAVSVKRGDLCI